MQFQKLKRTVFCALVVSGVMATVSQGQAAGYCSAGAASWTGGERLMDNLGSASLNANSRPEEARTSRAESCVKTGAPPEPPAAWQGPGWKNSRQTPALLNFHF